MEIETNDPARVRTYLFMDDDPVRMQEVIVRAEGRQKKHVWAQTADQAICILKMGWRFDGIMLDHDLHPEHYRAFAEGRPVPASAPPTGMKVAEWLAANVAMHECTPISVHTLNEGAGRAMVHLMRKAGLSAHYNPWGWLKD